MKVLAKACLLVSLAAFLWTAYEVAGRFIPGMPGLVQTSTVVVTDAESQAPKKAIASYEVDRIVAAHLFGVVEQKKIDRTVDAPETKLQLSLLGLMTSNNQDLARAMISVNRGKVKSYGLGQQIESTDAMLYAIQSSDVLLDRNGTLERLRMRRELIAGLSKESDGDSPN